MKETPAIDAINFSDALCRATYDAAAVLLAVRGYFDTASSHDKRRNGLEKLAADHLERLTELHHEFERQRQSNKNAVQS
jgi:hypothetical protein